MSTEGIFQIALILATFLLFPGGRLSVCFCGRSDAGHRKFK